MTVARWKITLRAKWGERHGRAFLHEPTPMESTLPRKGVVMRIKATIVGVIIGVTVFFLLVYLRPFSDSAVSRENLSSSVHYESQEKSVAPYNAGIVLEEKGDDKNALIAYDIAVGADPELQNAWVNRANVKLRLGDQQGALDDAKQAVSLDQRDPLAYMAKANALISLKEYSAAISDLDRALQLPDAPMAVILQSRGHANAKAGNLDLAVADTKKAMELTPKNVELYCNLAIFYARQRNSEAVSVVERAMKIDLSDPCAKQLWQSTESLTFLSRLLIHYDALSRYPLVSRGLQCH